MEKLTVEQALQQGYKYAVPNNEDFYTCESIQKLKQSDFENAEALSNGYVLCTKDPSHFYLSKDDIEELITEKIDCQDEFNDEDGELSGIALEGCEDLLNQLIEKINTNLSSKNYYFKTDIKLVP